jgi:hypothetical protein
MRTSRGTRNDETVPWKRTRVPRFMAHNPFSRPLLPDGGIKAFPLHPGKHKRSETEALKEELRDAGFPEDSGIIWLAKSPVAKSVPVLWVDLSKLDLTRLVRPGNGYFLYVGDIPASALKPAGRRVTQEFVQGGWTDELVEDGETGEETWVSINESADTWIVKPKPAPPGAVLATPTIAAWFNRVGYFHGLLPSRSHKANWSGTMRAHGGLYVYSREDHAHAEAMYGVEAAHYGGQDWAVYRIHVQPGDFLAVDEDHWGCMRFRREEAATARSYLAGLRRWGADGSIREYKAQTTATGIWNADRAWAEAFVLRWSGPIIETCVRKKLVDPKKLPNLRVWSTR